MVQLGNSNKAKSGDDGVEQLANTSLDIVHKDVAKKQIKFSALWAACPTFWLCLRDDSNHQNATEQIEYHPLRTHSQGEHLLQTSCVAPTYISCGGTCVLCAVFSSRQRGEHLSSPAVSNYMPQTDYLGFQTTIWQMIGDVRDCRIL